MQRLERDTAFTRKGSIPVYSGLWAIIHFISSVENAFPYLSTCLRSNCPLKQNIDPHLTSKMAQFWDNFPDCSDPTVTSPSFEPLEHFFQQPSLCSPPRVPAHHLKPPSFSTYSPPFSHTEPLALSKAKYLFFILSCFFKDWFLGNVLHSFFPVY